MSYHSIAERLSISLRGVATQLSRLKKKHLVRNENHVWILRPVPINDADGVISPPEKLHPSEKRAWKILCKHIGIPVSRPRGLDFALTKNALIEIKSNILSQNQYDEVAGSYGKGIDIYLGVLFGKDLLLFELKGIFRE